MTQKRYLVEPIAEDLKEKMVFLGGPRQVGKTTLAEDLLSAYYSTAYFSWDKLQSRNMALQGKWPANAELIILDEFHKHRKWKSWIKGEYDVHKKTFKFILTGSAKLDIYRRGGDSLQGRYHYYRLHPFSMAEISGLKNSIAPFKQLSFQSSAYSDLDTLLHFGGFPEPFIRQEERHKRRWHQERMERLFKEDIRDLTLIQDFGNLVLLSQLLPEKAAGVLSINSLAEDLHVNFRTIANWLNVFESFFYCFRLEPFQNRRIASVRKEKKLYLWDWSLVPEDGLRLENLVASHLLKFCDYLKQVAGYICELYYLRDSTGREVDFLVTIDRKPWFAVEVKLSDTTIAKNLITFKEKLKIPFCYQVHLKKDEFIKEGIHVLPVSRFLSGLV